MASNPSSSRANLTDDFLKQLVEEFNDTHVRAIILHGSYARGDAYSPYSDVDIVRILQETPERTQQKRFIWRNGYLLNLSSRPLSIYRDWLTVPQEAIYRLSTIRDAHILMEKDGAFRQFQQEVITQWRWEPLQPEADRYASQLMVELSETILRILRALQTQNVLMLTQRIFLHILPRVFQAVAVQKGILATGNNYLFQVQNAVGLDSSWTRHHMAVTGTGSTNEALSLEQRGLAALLLYQDTVQMLYPSFSQEHRETIDVVNTMIEDYWSARGTKQ